VAESTAGTISQYRVLGNTGERVSPIGIGGHHLGKRSVDEQLSLRIVRTAIDRGVNFLDNSWDYNGGASEIRMGKALRDGYPDKVFLMTKIDGRSKREATRFDCYESRVAWRRASTRPRNDDRVSKRSALTAVPCDND
jgi:aryl-alcohol dehydrogenase-like predicted oxidoreductase